MRRRETWTVSGGGSYTGKSRPAVIVQDDGFDVTNSIMLCPFTIRHDRSAVDPPPGRAGRAKRP